MSMQLYSSPCVGFTPTTDIINNNSQSNTIKDSIWTKQTNKRGQRRKNEIVGQSWCIKVQIRERCWAAPGGSGRYLIHFLHLLALEKQVASHTLHSHSYTKPREIGGGGTKKAEQSKEKTITRWTGPVWATWFGLLCMLWSLRTDLGLLQKI